MLKTKLSITHLVTCLGLAMLVCLTACVSDNRKFFSPLRRTMRLSDSDEVVQKKLLAFTRLGTPRDDVYKFLTNNFGKTAEIELDDPAPGFGRTDADSTISVNLWSRYWWCASFDTFAVYNFDKKKRLYHLDAGTATTAF